MDETKAISKDVQEFKFVREEDGKFYFESETGYKFSIRGCERWKPEVGVVYKFVASVQHGLVSSFPVDYFEDTI